MGLRRFDSDRDLKDFKVVIMERDHNFLENLSKNMVLKQYVKLSSPIRYEVYEGAFEYRGSGKVANKLVESFKTTGEFLDYIGIDKDDFNLGDN